MSDGVAELTRSSTRLEADGWRKLTVEPAAMLNCEKFRIALLLVLIVVTAPFCETAADPFSTPLK